MIARTERVDWLENREVREDVRLKQSDERTREEEEEHIDEFAEEVGVQD